MFVSDKYKFVFVHIPKSGGTTFKKILREGFNDCKNPFQNTHHPTMKQFLEKFPEKKEYYFFTMVRNPLDYHVSGYFYAKTNPEIPKEIYEASINLNFKEWVDFIHGKKNLFSNTITKFVCNEEEKTYKNLYIGRYENFDEEVKNIITEIYQRHVNRLLIPVTNKTNHKAFMSYYDKDSLNKIKELSKKDFNNFYLD